MTTNTTTKATASKSSEKYNNSIPFRQIRAHYDEQTITVYQAYSAEIATAAVKHQKLNASPTFNLSRMTWVRLSPN
jgi:hypothetical protein